MIALVIFLTFLFIAIAVGAMAAWSDFKGLTIPNWHSAVIFLSFVVAYCLMRLLGHGDIFSSLWSHGAAGLVVFAVTALLFALGTMGAGDSKLSTAYAFWAGMAGLPAFLFYMALMGGFIGLATLFLRKRKPFRNASPGSWIARAQAGENKVPYGIAIVFGALASFVHLGYLGATILRF